MFTRRTYVISFFIFGVSVFLAGCLPCTDVDGDGYGETASFECPNFQQDCDDADPDINPGAPDIMGGDGIDNNCNGQIDEQDISQCMTSQCSAEMQTCIGNSTCTQAMLCTSGCLSDLEPERCQIECSVTNYSPLLEDLMACSVEKGCFPDSTYECPIPPDASSLADIDVGDLEGNWYVIRGLSNTFDCWDCERYTFTETSATTAHYDFLYTVESGVSDIVPCTTTAIPFDGGAGTPDPGRFQVEYYTIGMPGLDQWYMLDYANNDPDYLLLYYCGSGPGTAYQGAVVLTRTPELALTQSMLDDFDAALSVIPDGPLMSDFCINDNSYCPDW